jgi:hypothetical protein
MMQQNFRRNAAHMQTRAAEKWVFFNYDCLQAPFARPDCRYVSPGSASNNSKVVFGQLVLPEGRPAQFQREFRIGGHSGVRIVPRKFTILSVASARRNRAHGRMRVPGVCRVAYPILLIRNLSTTNSIQFRLV